MKVILQRVSEADVRVDDQIVGAIQDGLCLLVGIEADDTTKELEWMAKKVAQLRIFRDGEGRMNRSLLEVGGAVLAISQFTLMADAVKGRRPSFVAAAPPEIAEPLFEEFCGLLREQGPVVETGRFGAHMMVRLINDGPVTIPLERRASS